MTIAFAGNRAPMAATPFPARLVRFATVGSTNDVVRDWLAGGTPEVCVAVADEQTAGRGRMGRRWTAPAGRALLVSVGFRPAYLPPDRAWRLAATVALAMADAAEDVAGLRMGALRLKWPNDLVVTGQDGIVRKVGGVLGESDGLGTADPRAVVGIGLNADWPASEFPPEIGTEMTSLREASGGRPIDRDVLLGAFLERLEARVLALRAGQFDLAGWMTRQVTTGRHIRLETAAGVETVRAVGVDGVSGALLVEGSDGTDRAVLSGEVHQVRLAAAAEGAATEAEAAEAV